MNKIEILEKLKEWADDSVMDAGLVKADNLKEYQELEGQEEEEKQAIEALVQTAGAVMSFGIPAYGVDEHEIAGNMMFLPDTEAIQAEDFYISIVMLEEINELCLHNLYRILNQINMRIVEGVFYYDENQKSVVYRQNAPVPVSMEQEEALQLANYNVILALTNVRLCIDLIMDVNNGRIEYTEAVEKVKNLEL